MTSATAPDCPAFGAVVTVDTLPTRVALSRVALSRADCMSLLAPGGHGRVAASRRAVPVIIPVWFTLVGEDVVLFPGSEDGAAGAIADCVVAFETDAVGTDERVVWDVHVTGVATALPAQTGPPAFRLPTEILVGWRIGGIAR